MGRAGTGIRSDVSTDRGIRASPPQRPSKAEIELEQPAAHRWPELCITRQVDIDSPLNQTGRRNWNGFLNKLGQINYGKGKAAALGSMACSYVTAVEMGKMLQKEYPDVYQNRAKTIQLHRRIARNYNEFVGRKERSGLEAIFAKTERLRLLEESDTFTGVFSPDEIGEQDYGDIILEVPDPSFIGWGMGTFVVNGLQKYSRNELGLNLTANEQLYDEWHETIDYCRHEGFDTKFIDRNREPHLVVFETFGLLGAIALSTPKYPDQISLNAPRALANTNSF